ncbi:MAG: hypothetical protein IT220_05700 [Flavobacteriaceae bacterium]|nr:hypothetical protein [Flavobacteriaceae bacterium]
MKTFKIGIILLLSSIYFISCQKDPVETALFAVPQTKKLSEIRASVGVKSAQSTDSDGKIYVTENHLFYIAQENGVHIFNNENPQSPVNVAFLAIEGVHDIAVKGNYLFADNFVDLLVFDISNLSEITLVKTLENTFIFNPEYPEGVEYYAWDVYPGQDEIIVGYTIETRPIPDDQYIYTMEGALSDMAASSGNGVGTGGSYAQFQINKNALYKVDKYKLNVYNIADPMQTFFDKEVYVNSWMGGELETLFKQKEFLFVGSTQGMYVVNAVDEFNPTFISGFSHATACDPVVVWDETAYITVRGGNTCGAIQDQVNVLNISNIENPVLQSTYLLHQPYGLGVKGTTLYVCTGNEGLNVFNALDSSNLILANHYNVNVTDVIPLDTHLILVGPNKVIQMNYGTDFTLTPISEINF